MKMCFINIAYIDTNGQWQQSKSKIGYITRIRPYPFGVIKYEFKVVKCFKCAKFFSYPKKMNRNLFNPCPKCNADIW